MKKLRCILILILTMALTSGFAACGGGGANSGGAQEQEPPLRGDSNILVTYFSWSPSGIPYNRSCNICLRNRVFYREGIME